MRKRENGSSAELSPAPARVILITGYPGLIATRLSQKILRSEPQTKLLLLTQEKSIGKAKLSLGSLPLEQQQRAEIIGGDIVAMDLGLSGAEYNRIIDEVTDIYHLASIYYLGVPRQEAYRVNVEGTQQVVELARACTRLQRLNHFSTSFVSGKRVGVITEEDLDAGQRFRNEYERTKFIAEKIIRAAAKDLPITILRPSIVVGDSKTGEIDQFRGIYHFGILIVASPVAVPVPLPVEGVAPLNLVPVDFVADASYHISIDPRSVGRTFHVVDPNPLSSRKVYELFAKRAGKRLPRWRLNYNLTRMLLNIPGLEKVSRHSAQTLDFLNHIAIYNSSNTMEILEGTGVLCPRFETYFETLISYVRHNYKQQRTEPPLGTQGAERPRE